MAISGHLMQCGIMSAFGGKADIVHGPSECPLLTQSGHVFDRLDCFSNVGPIRQLFEIMRGTSKLENTS